MASDTLHEPAEVLGAAIIDRHRAIASLREELDAVDWYDQRIAATDDADLREVLTHNRDEEQEHAAMLIEWLRRRDTAFDAQLRLHLWSTGPITVEAGGESAPKDPAAGDGSLGIGSLKQVP